MYISYYFFCNLYQWYLKYVRTFNKSLLLNDQQTIKRLNDIFLDEDFNFSKGICVSELFLINFKYRGDGPFSATPFLDPRMSSKIIC